MKISLRCLDIHENIRTMYNNSHVCEKPSANIPCLFACSENELRLFVHSTNMLCLFAIHPFSCAYSVSMPCLYAYFENYPFSFAYLVDMLLLFAYSNKYAMFICMHSDYDMFIRMLREYAIPCLFAMLS